MIARAACLVLLMLATACGRKGPRPVRSGAMEPPAFWVWHRGSELGADECDVLRKAGVRRLYWQVAECGWSKHAWRVNAIARPRSNGDPRVTPVYRLKPDPSFLGSPVAARKLADLIRGSAAPNATEEVQLDFDCPDRLLEDYGRFLTRLGECLAPTRVSITALASWPRCPGFGKLTASVSSIAPMFYDLVPDRPEDVLACRYQPMADPGSVSLIKLWARCPIPWCAGLPNFERLSAFGPDGKLMGHLRGWVRDEVFFHPDLRLRVEGKGITLFETSSGANLSGTRIPPRGTLVHRMPDAAVLETLVKTADEAGAAGILYFALPGPGLQASYTPSHLAHAGEPPKPLVSLDDRGAVTLRNPGPCDLPTRVWELELHSENSAAFRSASPGGFSTVCGSGGIPPELSGTIILRFAGLPAGGAIVSGPLVANAEGLSWSIPGVSGKREPFRKDSAR